MKRKLIVLTIAISIFAAACERSIELEPKNSLSPETALADVNGYEAVLTSVYSRIQGFDWWGRTFALMGDAMADNIVVNASQAGNRYTAQNVNARNSHYNIWGVGYSAVNEVNTIIANIDGLDVLPSEENKKKQIKAEALALRGFIYFDLARVYGYEPGKIPTSGDGAGFDRSVVLRLNPTQVVADAEVMNRNSVTEVYTQIEADLQAAISIFSELGSSSVYRMGLGSAYAQLGKVYLYWEKYSEAVAAFDNALANTSATLASDYSSIFTTVPSPESLFELRFIQATEMAGVTGVNESLYTYTQPNGMKNQLSTYGGQLPSPELMALFEEDDSRNELFFKSPSTTTAAILDWVNKYDSSNGTYTDNVKVIRYADVLLMKAEALAEQGNFTGAHAVLVELREARNASIDAIPNDAAINNFIQEERQRELFFEGHRWFDLKRKGAGITKPASLGVGTIPHTDYRLLAPIPVSAVDFNPELPQNPNY